MKPLENTDLLDLRLGSDFLDISTNNFKKKIDKLNFIKIKIYCTSKDTIKEMKRQHNE